MHPYITAQIAKDRHQERLADAARQRLVREVVRERAERKDDGAPTPWRARWTRQVHRVPVRLRLRAA